MCVIRLIRSFPDRRLPGKTTWVMQMVIFRRAVSRPCRQAILRRVEGPPARQRDSTCPRRESQQQDARPRSSQTESTRFSSPAQRNKQSQMRGASYSAPDAHQDFPRGPEATALGTTLGTVDSVCDQVFELFVEQIALGGCWIRWHVPQYARRCARRLRFKESDFQRNLPTTRSARSQPKISAELRNIAHKALSRGVQ